MTHGSVFMLCRPQKSDMGAHLSHCQLHSHQQGCSGAGPVQSIPKAQQLGSNPCTASINLHEQQRNRCPHSLYYRPHLISSPQITSCKLSYSIQEKKSKVAALHPPFKAALFAFQGRYYTVAQYNQEKQRRNGTRAVTTRDKRQACSAMNISFPLNLSE